MGCDRPSTGADMTFSPGDLFVNLLPWFMALIGGRGDEDRGLGPSERSTTFSPAGDFVFCLDRNGERPEGRGEDEEGREVPGAAAAPGTRRLAPHRVVGPAAGFLPVLPTAAGLIADSLAC